MFSEKTQRGFSLGANYQAYWISPTHGNPGPVLGISGKPVGDSLERLRQPGELIDVVQFCRLQKGGDGCPRPATAMATREERIFSRYCLGSDGPFDNVGIYFDTAVEEEAPKNLPSGGGVADRLGQF